MHFEYEITEDIYIASQLLNYKLSGGDRRRFLWAAIFILAGPLFLGITWSRQFSDWLGVLLGFMGACCFYIGFRSLFPAAHLRRAYRAAALAGKKYRAEMNEDGFEVNEDLRGWHVRWPGVEVKGENEIVFILRSQGTIFMFGKRYLNSEQQRELRKLSGLLEPRA